MVESQLQQRFLGNREYREGKRRAWQRMEWLYHEVDGITGRKSTTLHGGARVCLSGLSWAAALVLTKTVEIPLLGADEF